MLPRLVIFDFDGTLHDSYPWFRSVINDVADRHGVRRVNSEEADELRGMAAAEIIRHLRVPSWKVPLIARDMRRMKAAALDTIPLFSGVDRLLQALSAQGTRTAMVSSDDETNVRRGLGSLQGHVHYWACGASLFGKAAKLRRVLRLSGFSADVALCIGDELRDMEAARKAGIPFGSVAWGYNSAETLAVREPAIMFTTMDGMIAHLTGGG